MARLRSTLFAWWLRRKSQHGSKEYSFMRSVITGIALVICCAASALADTNVSGSITTNTTWTAANSPYIVNGPSSVSVNSGVTLTIEPGVTVKFGSGYQL